VGGTGWAAGAKGPETDGPEGAGDSAEGTGADGAGAAEGIGGAEETEEAGTEGARTEGAGGAGETEGAEGGGGRRWDEDCMPDGGGAGAQGGWPVGWVVPNLKPHVSQN
jgi:hypothetical protein